MLYLLCVMHDGLTQDVDGTHVSELPVSKQPVNCFGGFPSWNTPKYCTHQRLQDSKYKQVDPSTKGLSSRISLIAQETPGWEGGAVPSDNIPTVCRRPLVGQRPQFHDIAQIRTNFQASE